ncbi:hypothetical protein AMAG_08329 [Allomyces macrogynus ATCC 38327]|uniref:Uncharacterized protein n=1 Tax=Allomyces macrogynus (strain ATCC 38327) TaxID=578462 RepID=A0A0L0SLB5_ALLM3|nr:hypothetical protein AMAG_08329 [Allomyces macrogynus ATCC 38327]|eukprot:KNE63175.1 hypothetical protein AMAG_08329 [Allomyces macrogynus ATCC 38327]
MSPPFISRPRTPHTHSLSTPTCSHCCTCTLLARQGRRRRDGSGVLHPALDALNQLASASLAQPVDSPTMARRVSLLALLALLQLVALNSAVDAHGPHHNHGSASGSAVEIVAGKDGHHYSYAYSTSWSTEWGTTWSTSWSTGVPAATATSASTSAASTSTTTDAAATAASTPVSTASTTYEHHDEAHSAHHHLHTPFHAAAIVKTNDSVYLFGGRDASGFATNQVLSLNLTSILAAGADDATPLPVADLPALPLSVAGAVPVLDAAQSRVLLVGGTTGRGDAAMDLNTHVVSYDLAAKKGADLGNLAVNFTALAPMHSVMAATPLGAGKPAYLFGGLDIHAVPESPGMHTYSAAYHRVLANGTISRVVPREGTISPMGRVKAAMARFNETHVALLGGFRDGAKLADVWWYNEPAAAWSRAPVSLAFPRFAHRAVVVKGRYIVAVGGMYGRGATGNAPFVEVYDVVKGTIATVAVEAPKGVEPQLVADGLAMPQVVAHGDHLVLLGGEKWNAVWNATAAPQTAVKLRLIKVTELKDGGLKLEWVVSTRQGEAEKPPSGTVLPPPGTVTAFKTVVDATATGKDVSVYATAKAEATQVVKVTAGETKAETKATGAAAETKAETKATGTATTDKAAAASTWATSWSTSWSTAYSWGTMYTWTGAQSTATTASTSVSTTASTTATTEATTTTATTTSAAPTVPAAVPTIPKMDAEAASKAVASILGAIVFPAPFPTQAAGAAASDKKDPAAGTSAQSVEYVNESAGAVSAQSAQYQQQSTSVTPQSAQSVEYQQQSASAEYVKESSVENGVTHADAEGASKAIANVIDGVVFDAHRYFPDPASGSQNGTKSVKEESTDATAAAPETKSSSAATAVAIAAGSVAAVAAVAAVAYRRRQARLRRGILLPTTAQEVAQVADGAFDQGHAAPSGRVAM